MPVAALRLTLLTPRGRAGVAVVACQGPQRSGLLAELVRTSSGRVPDLLALRVPRLCAIEIDGERIDEALVLDRPEHELLELHVHGSEAVLRALEARFGSLEAQEPDTAERLLRDALGTAQLELALEQLAEPFGPYFARLRAEAGPVAFAAARAALARSVVARAQIEPAPLVICGAQNAGKSTLLNRLVLHERALTGPLPGLTRDPVEDLTTLAGYPYRVFDTAGEGEAVDALDRAAQRRGRELREGAFRLVVVPAPLGPSSADRALADERTVWVRSKCDLGGPRWPDECAPVVAVHALDAGSAPGIRAVVGETLRTLRGLPEAGRVGGPAALGTAEFAALAEFVAAAVSQ